MSDLAQTFAAMAGQRVPGGCDTCNAWQEMALSDGILVINVCHDDWCPTYRQHHTKAKP